MSSFSYFISDLHLSADREDINTCLFEFLAKQAPQADALYVLGDLFEIWIGDDDLNDFTLSIAHGFKALKDQGIPIFFIHGNRDFLVRDKFASLAGMEILPEQYVANLYGYPTLIMHGDELCTKDIEYQQFRKKARGWWWPKLMLMLPLSTRRKIAEKGRKTSQKNHTNLTAEIMDVTQQEVEKAMLNHQVTRVISRVKALRMIS